MKVRRFVPWASVGGLLLLVAGAATGSALTAPSHPPVVAASTQPPGALPSLPTGTEPVPASTSPVPPPVVVPSPTTPLPPSGVTTTTTVQAAACQASQFDVVLATDKTTYQTGETVQITMSVKNDGPTCGGTDAAFSGPCGLGMVTATNASGQEAWDSDGNPNGDVYSCPSIGFQQVPADWSTTVQFSWTQDDCVPGASVGPPQTNPQCPQTQVAPGTYSLVGGWNVGNSESQSPPVSITIL